MYLTLPLIAGYTAARMGHPSVGEVGRRKMKGQSGREYRKFRESTGFQGGKRCLRITAFGKGLNNLSRQTRSIFPSPKSRLGITAPLSPRASSPPKERPKSEIGCLFGTAGNKKRKASCEECHAWPVEIKGNILTLRERYLAPRHSVFRVNQFRNCTLSNHTSVQVIQLLVA